MEVSSDTEGGAARVLGSRRTRSDGAEDPF